MCAPSQGVLLPYGLKIPSPYFPFGPGSSLSQVHLSALDFQRSQLNEYNVRVQLGLRNYQNTLGMSPFQAYINDPYTQAYFYKHDPRARFVHEEPKPSHSYIGLIGMAILNSKDKKLVLSDIYQWILDNYPYFRTRGPGWRNSIRHNLSLNDCFIKAGRSANGKGHYWAVHPANVEDFERGDFRRRRAQRKVRRHMGLSVPDDDDSPTPSPTQSWPHHDMAPDHDRGHLDPAMSLSEHTISTFPTEPSSEHLIISHHAPSYGPLPVHPRKPSKKRLFDVASLLAPDDDDEVDQPSSQMPYGDPLKGTFISGFSLHQMNDAMKSDRRPSSGHSKDSSVVNEHSRDVTSRSSCSAKGDLSYESDDDDLDDNEIHVTSGENSPAHEMDEDCDMEHSGDSDFLTRERKDFLSPDHKNYDHVPASGKILNGAKNDHAIDLTSAVSITHGDVKDVSGEVNFKMGNKFNTDIKSHLDSRSNVDNKVNMDNDRSHHSSHRSSSTSDAEQECVDQKADARHGPRDKNVNGELNEATTTTSSEMTGDSARHASDKFHLYHADMSRQRHFELSGGLVDSNRNHLDMRRAASDVTTSPISDPVRLASAEALRWSELSKCVLPRDRMSAFSALGVRTHPMYPPFQMRSFTLPQQRLLPMGPPVRPGSHAAALSGPNLSPSMPLLKALESYGSGNNASIATTTSTAVSSRGGTRENDFVTFYYPRKINIG
ncbi:hypothetical protein Btru_038284 [Bulinus truncatus]|nr:hypothetical protein Btru_038284 [Bulinus truncatus]